MAFLQTKLFNVGLDIYGVLANFLQGFLDLGHQMGFGDEMLTIAEWTVWDPFKEETFRTIWDALKDDPEFWLNLSPTNENLNFHELRLGYITARPIPMDITLRWLKKHGFPINGCTTVAYNQSKVVYVKWFNLDFFLEDRFEAFLEINQNSDCICFLLLSPYTRPRLDEIPDNLRHYTVESVQEYLDIIKALDAFRLQWETKSFRSRLVKHVRTPVFHSNAGRTNQSQQDS